MCAADGIIYPGFEYGQKNDSIGTVILPNVEEQIRNITKECLKTLVVFIGGAADSITQPLLRGVFVRYEKNYQRTERLQDVAYSEHGGREIAELIKKWADAGQKIVLVGHSWGGHRAICVAENSPEIAIEYLVTLDPVSWSKNGKQPKPNNVKKWANIYVDYEIADYSLPNFIARTGGAWQHCEFADINYPVNVGWINGEKINNGVNHAHAGTMFEFTEIENEINKI